MIAVGLQRARNSASRSLRQCLKFSVSLGGSPQRSVGPAVPKLFQNPMFLCPRGLLRARSRFPEIVENIKNRKQRMESLECRKALAKQVLSQLSYTPTRCNQYTLNSLQRVLQRVQLRVSVHSVQQQHFRMEVRSPSRLSRLLACEIPRRPSAWNSCLSPSFPRGHART